MAEKKRRRIGQRTYEIQSAVYCPKGEKDNQCSLSRLYWPSRGWEVEKSVVKKESDARNMWTIINGNALRPRCQGNRATAITPTNTPLSGDNKYIRRTSSPTSPLKSGGI